MCQDEALGPTVKGSIIYKMGERFLAFLLFMMMAMRLATVKAFREASIIGATTRTGITRAIPPYTHSSLFSPVTKPVCMSSSSSSSSFSPRKGGVASPDELRAFVEEAGDRLVVIDVRNPDATVEPGDQKSLAVAGLPASDGTYRPKALHLIWDREKKSMPLPAALAKDTPIITHCGGGGRGQLAKEFLLQHGFTQVLNGGGPKETECWAVFGDQ